VIQYLVALHPLVAAVVHQRHLALLALEPQVVLVVEVITVRVARLHHRVRETLVALVTEVTAVAVEEQARLVQQMAVLVAQGQHLLLLVHP
jgi:hypothetical protein